MPGPKVRFPSPKMARGSSVVMSEGVQALEKARREEKSRRPSEETAPETAASRDARVVSADTASFEQQLEEQLAAEAARMAAAGIVSPASPAPASERGLSSLNLLRTKRRRTAAAPAQQQQQRTAPSLRAVQGRRLRRALREEAAAVATLRQWTSPTRRR